MTFQRTAAMVALLMMPRLALARHKPPPTYTIPLPAAPDFSPLSWLVGAWRGRMVGHSPRGKARLSVRYALGHRVMVFHEELSLQSGRAMPQTKESWIGVLTALHSGSLYRLDFYSSTGFVIRYTVTCSGPEIRLNFSGGPQTPPGWLFRQTIERTSLSEFTESVEVAPPGKPFFNYYKIRFVRVAPAPASNPQASH